MPKLPGCQAFLKGTLAQPRADLELQRPAALAGIDHPRDWLGECTQRFITLADMMVASSVSSPPDNTFIG